MAKKKQTWGIWLAVSLLIIGGIVTILSTLFSAFIGATIAALGTNLPVSAITGTLIIATIIYLILGAAYIATAWFLWEHKTWAWWAAIGLTALGLIFGFFSMITAFNFVTLGLFILNIVVIVGLCDPKAIKLCKVKFE